MSGSDERVAADGAVGRIRAACMAASATRVDDAIGLVRVARRTLGHVLDNERDGELFGDEVTGRLRSAVGSLGSALADMYVFVLAANVQVARETSGIGAGADGGGEEDG